MRGNNAQLHVLEAVISVGIIFITMVFVYQQITAPIHVSPYPTSQLKVLCDGALYAMWEMSSTNESYPGSLLSQLIIENNTVGFCDNISKFLPKNVFYNVWIYDGVNRKLWYPWDRPNEPIGNVVVSHQLIVARNQLLVVELEAWEV